MENKKEKMFTLVKGEIVEVYDPQKEQAKQFLAKQLLEEWEAHYNNETEESQWATQFIKKTFSGRGDYIAWSVMVAVLKKLDYFATVETMLNEEGGFVFTQKIGKPTKNSKVETNTEIDQNDGEVTKTTSFEQDIYTEAQIHFVKVKIVYKGMVHIEEYPILDNNHQPTDNLNSALVNKNIQRAKARGISTVTGVGFSLWTQEDTENEGNNNENKDVKKDTPKKPVKKTETVKKELTKTKDVKKDIDEAIKNDVMDLSATPSLEGKDIPINEQVALFITMNKDNENVIAKLKQMSPAINTRAGEDVMEFIGDEKHLSEIFSKVPRLEDLFKVLKGD